MNFRKKLNEPGLICIDGAMGTLLFQKLPGFSGCFELLNVENPEVILDIHRAYADIGVQILETNSFGGSTLKLAEYGLAHRCEELNSAAAAIAKKAAEGRNVFVGGSIGPIGSLIEPMGDITPEEAYASFTLQARGLAKGGADLIIIETMTDLQEAKIALLAAKENTPLPIICSMSFEENGKTVSGTDMLTGLATLAEYGADVVGANCSMGPSGLVKVYSGYISRLLELGVPLSVWSNAGMPEIRDGKTIYTISPESFAETSMEFARMGLKVIGGCCGTTPAHISALIKATEGFPTEAPSRRKGFYYATSRFQSLNIGRLEGLLKIGERLNPTARKKFAEELRQGQFQFLREESRKQEEEGAQVLDINVGVPSIDEIGAMRRSVSILAGSVKTPLMIDSDNAAVLEKALLTYPGVGIVNSINGKQKSLESILHLIKRFGCFVVALCMDDTGIHADATKRIAVGEKLLETLDAEGISADRVIVDTLMLAEGAEPGSARETLKVIEHFARRGIKTSVGLSNISFGLPQRKHINNAFLNLAIEKGLTAAIINPSALKLGFDGSQEEQMALDFLQGRDEKAARYIAHFSALQAETGGAGAAPVGKSGGGDMLDGVYRLVVEGNSDEIAGRVTEALKSFPPDEIMNRGLIRALEKVGDMYSSGEYFLPQMIASAQAMKAGFDILKPHLTQSASEKKGKLVVCTVKGDVHDIGKNIVAMMFENHGFEVHDLGKDVSTDVIIETVKRIKPDILGLSSLLTTTMTEMKVISDRIREENLPVKLLLGGAVVTREYAESLGASYGADAVEGVKVAQTLMARTR